MESELQQSKKNEEDLRTKLNAKDAENEQIVSEYHETKSELQEKIDELGTFESQVNSRVASLEEEHRSELQKLEAQTETLSNHLREVEKGQIESQEKHEQTLGLKNAQINDLNEQIRILQSQLAESELQHTTMEIGLNQKLELQRTLSMRLQRRLDERLTAMRQSFDSERSKRERTASAASRFHSQLTSLKNDIKNLEHQNRNTGAALKDETRRRKEAESLVRSSTARLNAVIKRANVLSTELNAFFQQISDGQAEAEFFETYEQACEVGVSKDEDSDDSEIGSLLGEETFLDDDSEKSDD